MNEAEVYRLVKTSTTGRDWHHVNCFGCGENNPRGLRAEFPYHEETGEVRFTFQVDKYYEGAPGFVHGGVLAALLDEAQGVVCFHAGHFVMTDQLYVKYNKATPLTEEIHVRAWITKVAKRRLYTKATIIDPRTNEILASSKARWYDMPERVYSRMFHRSPLAIDRLKLMLEENKKRGKNLRQNLKKNKK
jgi:acyl-coenzyme A thioesterase PaaI-like protein